MDIQIHLAVPDLWYVHTAAGCP